MLGRAETGRAREAQKSAEVLPKILRVAAVRGTLHRQQLKCGKSTCKCARGQLHEAHYLFVRSPSGARRKLYVRRAEVARVVAVADRRLRKSAWRAELSEARAFLRGVMSGAAGVKR